MSIGGCVEGKQNGQEATFPGGIPYTRYARVDAVGRDVEIGNTRKVCLEMLGHLGPYQQ